ncbi:MAG: CoA-binding protein, partial [Bacillota bacterium]
MTKLQEALEQDVYAVVGASTNKAKYGYKVFKVLSKYDLTVYPINPSADEIAGEKCYDNLAELPQKVDVAVTVVPAKISEQILDEAADLDIPFVWMQPG